MMLRCVVADWHIASFRCAAKLVAYWTNNGERSGLVLNGSVAIDAVDGAHSAASKCHRVVASKRNHIEGSRPWAKLARSGSILRSQFSDSRHRCGWYGSDPQACWSSK